MYQNHQLTSYNHIHLHFMYLVICNYIVGFISAYCNGLTKQTNACNSWRYINTTGYVQSHGVCIKPEVCNCRQPDSKPNYFYPDGPYCKRKSSNLVYIYYRVFSFKFLFFKKTDCDSQLCRNRAKIYTIQLLTF